MLNYYMFICIIERLSYYIIYYNIVYALRKNLPNLFWTIFLRKYHSDPYIFTINFVVSFQSSAILMKNEAGGEYFNNSGASTFKRDFFMTSVSKSCDVFSLRSRATILFRSFVGKPTLRYVFTLILIFFVNKRENMYTEKNSKFNKIFNPILLNKFLIRITKKLLLSLQYFI